MRTVLVTGSSQGIGKETVDIFLKNNFKVIGVDIQSIPKDLKKNSNYKHIKKNIKNCFNSISRYDFNYIIHNAGIQEGKCIDVNLKDTIDLNEKLLKKNKNIKAITFNTSISAIYGDEFPLYVASKAGLNGYVKNVAKRLMPNAISNAVCFGGVKTELNKPIIESKELWEKVIDINPLHKWMTAEEAAEWIYFVTVTNTFATGQLFEIDGGENSCPSSTFVWKD